MGDSKIEDVSQSDLLLLKQEVKADLSVFKQEVKADLSAFKQEVKFDLSAFKQEMENGYKLFIGEVSNNVKNTIKEQLNTIRNITVTFVSVLILGFWTFFEFMDNKREQLHGERIARIEQIDRSNSERVVRMDEIHAAIMSSLNQSRTDKDKNIKKISSGRCIKQKH